MMPRVEPRESSPATQHSLAIEVKGLVKRYNDRVVVDHLSFTVPRGEFFALLGPNGAGKTTTIEILEGYRRPDAGFVRVLGLDPWHDGHRLKPRIGVMLQAGGIYPTATPREVVELFAAFYPDPEDPSELLRLVGLEDVSQTRYRYLSGGQQRRLEDALCILCVHGVSCVVLNRVVRRRASRVLSCRSGSCTRRAAAAPRCTSGARRRCAEHTSRAASLCKQGAWTGAYRGLLPRHAQREAPDRPGGALGAAGVATRCATSRRARGHPRVVGPLYPYPAAHSAHAPDPLELLIPAARCPAPRARRSRGRRAPAPRIRAALG